MCAWREEDRRVCRECGEHALYFFICLLLCLLTLPLLPCALTCSLILFNKPVSGLLLGLFITSFFVVQWGFRWPITSSHAQPNLRTPHILRCTSLSTYFNSFHYIPTLTLNFTNIVNLPRLFTKTLNLLQ